MRISDIDLQCEDIMWFAIDTNGNIFECTSAGCGNVPEYVCKSREETDMLLEYFTNTAPIITEAKLLIPASENDLTADAINLASKGIYCYDVTDYDNAQSHAFFFLRAGVFSVSASKMISFASSMLISSGSRFLGKR